MFEDHEEPMLNNHAHRVSYFDLSKSHRFGFFSIDMGLDKVTVPKKPISNGLIAANGLETPFLDKSASYVDMSRYILYIHNGAP